jgi:hypothetical protein
MIKDGGGVNQVGGYEMRGGQVNREGIVVGERELMKLKSKKEGNDELLKTDG